MRRYEVIVVGIGGVGSAVLCHLARRGVRALGLDRFPPGHDRGSSHGSTRIIRQAYFEHADYVPLLLRAWQLWAELAERHGRPLLEEVGLLQVGPADGVVVPAVLKSARMHRLAVEQVPPREIVRRWPGFAAGDGLIGAYERRAGYLHVEDGVQAHVSAALSAGAELACDRAVVAWRREGSGIAVETDREEICADRLVITAGPWAGDLLADFAVRLTVLRKPVFWLATRDESYRAGCPCFLYELPVGIFYGIPQVDERGVKVAEHSGGEPVVDPLSVDRGLRADDHRRVAAFVETYLPRASGEVRHHSVCMYTMTPDQHFVVDFHPSFPRVVFVAGLSGHGFKFAPVLGEIAADLALDGRTPHPIGFLRVGRFHS